MDGMFQITRFSLVFLLMMGCRFRQSESAQSSLHMTSTLKKCCLCHVNHYADNWRSNWKSSQVTDKVRKKENQEIVGDLQNNLGTTYQLSVPSDKGCSAAQIGYKKVAGFAWDEDRVYDCREVSIYRDECSFFEMHPVKTKEGEWLPAPEADPRRPVFLFKNPTTKNLKERVLVDYKVDVRGIYKERLEIKKDRFYRIFLKSPYQLGRILYGTPTHPDIVVSPSEKLLGNKRSTPGLSTKSPYVFALENWTFILTVESYEKSLAPVSIKVVEYLP